MAVADRTASVRVDVLGPLRLLVDGQAVDVRGPKRRAVLALLAVAEGRAVTLDHLLDALWPVELPESARGALHSHVFRLRGHLGPAGHRLETLDGAYRLALGPDDLDAARARLLLARARGLARTDPAAAVEVLRAVRGLWRGPALSEFTDVAPLATAATGLEHLHHEATDLLITCTLDAGQVDGVVALATEVLVADPLREPAVLQLMRALAATGQTAQALSAARDYRRRLVEDTGLDPSSELAALEQAIADGQVAAADVADARPSPPVRPVRPARPVTPLVGRDASVSALQRLLDSERLVTIVGPGGVGKTRVALELARRTDTVAVLHLASVIDPGAIPHALAQTLGLREVQGDVLVACTAQLGAAPGVLVVDNCEHLIDAVRDLVATLLSACPELNVLATSREPLGLPGECASRLAPLPLPGDGNDAELARVPSVAVFLDRAARVRPGFAPAGPELRLVAELVRHLDGMPLAIELAAGRLSTFSLAELSQRLDRSLDLLGGGRPTGQERHRTLRATVEWS
jgi:DNA-binding SARP family transcriptional activator